MVLQVLADKNYCHCQHNHLLRTSMKKTHNKKNQKRSEIEKRKTLGNIMKFQNLKLEKERETEESKNQKRQRIE